MSDLEIELVKYSKKTWTKSAVLGFFIGLAVIVPGISGSTVAIIFKLYRQFLYAIGHLFDQFKKCFVFLLPIGIGMVIGVVSGFIGVKALLEILPFAIICLFAGLMIPLPTQICSLLLVSTSVLVLFQSGILIWSFTFFFFFSIDTLYLVRHCFHSLVILGFWML